MASVREESSGASAAAAAGSAGGRGHERELCSSTEDAGGMVYVRGVQQKCICSLDAGSGYTTPASTRCMAGHVRGVSASRDPTAALQLHSAASAPLLPSSTHPAFILPPHHLPHTSLGPALLQGVLLGCRWTGCNMRDHSAPLLWDRCSWKWVPGFLSETWH